MRFLSLACALIIASACGSFHASAADTNKAPSKSSQAAAPGKKRPLPFHGNIGQVDKAANSIKVGKQIYYVAPETKVMKNGKQSSLEDAKPGDEVGGSYRDTGGRKVLVSLRIGPKT